MRNSRLQSFRDRAVVNTALLVAGGLVLAACGAESSTDPAGSTSGEGRGEKTKVAIVVHYSGPAPEENKNGANAAAQAAGAEVQTLSPPQFDSAQQIQLFKDAITAGAKGVAVVPYPEDVWKNTVDDTIDDGVLVTSFNSPAPSTKIPLYVGVNETDFGREEAKLALSFLGSNPSGDVVVGNCLPGVGVLERRVTGIKDYMGKNAPGVKVLGPFKTDGDPTANFAAWQGLREKYKSAVAMIGVCAQDGPSLAKVQAKEGPGSFVGVTSDLGPEVFTGLKDGTLQGAVSQSPWMQGYGPTRALIDALQQGKPLPQGWLDSGIEPVTKDNVTEIESCETSEEAQSKCFLPEAEKIFSNLSANLKPLDAVLS